MLLSVQTAHILDVYGIDEGFRLLRDLGFRAVDLNIDHCLSVADIKSGNVHGFYDQTDAQILAACEPYRAAAEKYGIQIYQVHAPFPGRVEDDSVNEYMQTVYEKSVMMCGAMNCPHVIIHPTCVAEDIRGNRDEWDFNIKMYTALIPALRKYHVTCCLENLFVRYRGRLMEGPCTLAEEAIRYIDTLNGIAGEELFGLCFDTGHALLTGKDIYRYVTTLGSRIKALHVHDNNGLDDEHLFPYMGIVPWNRFCEALKAIDYRGTLSFETFNALKTFDPQLTPQLLQLLAATGRLFVERIEG